MKKNILIKTCLLLFSALTANSQSISPAIINSIGKSLQNANSAMEINIGEPITGLITNGKYYISQGFLQPHVGENCLAAYYPFTGNAADSSGYGNNGTLSGATLTTDRFGGANKAYSFDGNLNQITVPSTVLANASQFTINSWFNANASQTGYSNIFQIDVNAANASNPSNNIYLRYESGLGVFRGGLEIQGSFNSVSAVTPPSTGVWHMGTLSYDGTILKLYIDGNFISQANQSGIFQSFYQPLYVGNWNAVEGFNGKVDDFRMYNCALSDLEIASLYTTSASCLTPVIGNISGGAAQCVPIGNGNATYSVVPQAGTTYTWSVPTGMTITGGQNTNSINVSWTLSASHFGIIGSMCVTATNACGTAQSCVPVDIQYAAPVTPNSITGLAKICAGDLITYSIAAVSRATGYTWTVPTGMIISSGQGSRTISATVGASFVSGNVSVKASNVCGSGPVRNKAVSKNIPGTPAPISGQTFGVCGGVTTSYTISATATATTYLWTVPGGATLNSGQGTTSISVTFPSNYVTGVISVKAGTTCGYGTVRNLTVKGTPSTALSITGPTTACANQQNVAYSTAAIATATSYTWGVPSGATITSGQGTTAIVMKYGTASGNVRVRAVNACGVGTYKNLAVVINCREGITDEANAFDVSVYPNPTNNYFTMKVNSELSSDYKLVVKDLLGREVKSYLNLNAAQSFDFGSEFLNGVYFLEVVQGENRMVERLVKVD